MQQNKLFIHRKYNEKIIDDIIDIDDTRKGLC